MLILNNDEIGQALDLQECLQIMEDAYRELTASRAVNRPTTHSYLAHSLPQATYSFKSVDGGIQKFNILALRLTSDIVREEKAEGWVRLIKLPRAGRGQYLGLVQLFNTDTGELLAIMPDGLIQQTRVGITSALGLKPLCREDAKTLGLIGSGGQARSHLRAFATARPLKQVKVFSPNAEHRNAFAAEMETKSGVEVVPVSSIGDAIEGSDILCTATNSSRPVIGGDWLAPGVHYNAIREFEVEESVFHKSDVIAIHSRFGGIQHYLPQGLKEDLPGVRREKERDWNRYPEIGDFLTGKAPGRVTDRQITFFLNNIGTGLQFAAIGFAVYRKAREMGLGREIPTDWFLQDIRP